MDLKDGRILMTFDPYDGESMVATINGKTLTFKYDAKTTIVLEKK